MKAFKIISSLNEFESTGFHYGRIRFIEKLKWHQIFGFATASSFLVKRNF